MAKSDAGIPVKITDVDGDLRKFQIDLTSPTGARVVNRQQENLNFLEFQFSVAGLKVPNNGGKPPGASHVIQIPIEGNEVETNATFAIADVKTKVIFKPDPADNERKIGTFFFQLQIDKIEVLS